MIPAIVRFHICQSTFENTFGATLKTFGAEAPAKSADAASGLDYRVNPTTLPAAAGVRGVAACRVRITHLNNT